MKTKRATIEVAMSDMTCVECGTRIIKGRTFTLLQADPRSPEQEPYCMGCLNRHIVMALELFLVER